jgi:hypothetical protein
MQKMLLEFSGGGDLGVNSLKISESNRQIPKLHQIFLGNAHVYVAFRYLGAPQPDSPVFFASRCPSLCRPVRINRGAMSR